MYDFLKGARIIELGHILMGPYAAQMLGDLGADVIKVEAPEGDFYRSVGVSASPGMSAQWMNVNRNKRSVTLDLKSAAGRDAMARLIEGANAFVHNMRPAAVARLGFSPEAARALNPALVYCFAAGFGSDGPYRDKPAFDDIIQGYSGLAGVNAAADGAPRLVPVSIADTVCGLILAQALLAGLYHQRASGEGAVIEAPMFEALAGVGLNQHLAGRAYDPPRGGLGYPRLSSAHRHPARTRDGYIIHGVYRAKHWRAFLTAVGREDVIEAGLIADDAALAANISRLYAIAAQDILPTRTTAQWRALFDALDIPSAPANTLESLLADPHLQAVGLLQHYEHPSEGLMLELRSPLRAHGVAQTDNRPPPRAGEHSAEILSELGLA